MAYVSGGGKSPSGGNKNVARQAVEEIRGGAIYALRHNLGLGFRAVAQSATALFCPLRQPW